MRKVSKLVRLTTPLLIGAGLLALLLPAYGAQRLLERSVQLMPSTPGTTATYELTFTLPADETLGSLRFTFCSNSPLLTDPCTAPTGFDLSAVNVSTQFGATNFLRGSGTTSNELILTRTAALANAGILRYDLQDIVNPNSSGSYYLRIQTYPSEDASGPATDQGGLAFAINPFVNVSAEVPPYLLFCSAVAITDLDCSTASGNYVNFGNLSANQSAAGQSQFLVATNALNGYSVSVSGTTLTSGNNIIAALASPDISRPGTTQFGINLRQNADPAIGADVTGPGQGQPVSPYADPDHFVFKSGSQIAFNGTVEDYRKYTVSYLINISKAQSSGVYVSTLSYNAIANF